MQQAAETCVIWQQRVAHCDSQGGRPGVGGRCRQAGSRPVKRAQWWMQLNVALCCVHGEADDPARIGMTSAALTSIYESQHRWNQHHHGGHRTSTTMTRPSPSPRHCQDCVVAWIRGKLTRTTWGDGGMISKLTGIDTATSHTTFRYSILVLGDYLTLPREI